jgi:F0F1-type ATP synthase membrane subunit c/vacuolar-type H+-ATPase subunit K
MDSSGTAQPSIEARYRVLLILWLAMLISIGMFFLISRLVPHPSYDSDSPLFAVMGALGSITLSLSFRFKSKFVAQSIEKQSASILQQGYIIAWALCEATALFGLLIFFVTGSRFYFFFFMFAVLGMLFHMPRRAHLFEASFKELSGGLTAE